MYENVLTSVGLTPEQAAVYEILLKNGRRKAAEIAKAFRKKRGITYKVLEELERKGLVVKKESSGEVTQFEAAHPGNLSDVVEQEERRITSVHSALEGVMSQMVSDFNRIIGKPGVRFYEGIDGMKKVLEDSLAAKETIYAYVDATAVVKYIKEVNDEYAKKREKLGVVKKSIIPDTPTTRSLAKGYHPAVTENRFIRGVTGFSDTVVQIYDGKVSYIILTPERMLGFIVQNDAIYRMQKSIFELVWNGLTTGQQSPPGR